MSDWTVEDIPDQGGAIVVITGASSGLGLESARALAGKGAQVVMAVRNPEKGAQAIDSIRESHRDASLELLEMDLASLSSVRSAAAELSERHERIDILINNAGLMATPWGTTADGFEMQMGVNHLGHFALTNLLLDRLMSTEGSRIVNVASLAHRFKSALDPETMMSKVKYDRIAAYGRSKLANLLFTYELQRRLTAANSDPLVLAAHPGFSTTNLAHGAPKPMQLLERYSGPLGQPAAMGALPQLRAATDPQARGGQYYGPGGFMEFRGHPVVVESSARSHDRDLQELLWIRSEELTEEIYAV